MLPAAENDAPEANYNREKKYFFKASYNY